MKVTHLTGIDMADTAADDGHEAIDDVSDVSTLETSRVSPGGKPKQADGRHDLSAHQWETNETKLWLVMVG